MTAKYYFEELQRNSYVYKIAYLTSPCPLQRGISPFGGGRGRLSLVCFKKNYQFVA
jgi:hypothetical protein